MLEEDELRVEEALGEVLEVLELLRVEEAGALALLVEEVLRVEVLALREEAAGAEVERLEVALELRVVVVEVERLADGVLEVRELLEEVLEEREEEGVEVLVAEELEEREDDEVEVLEERLLVAEELEERVEEEGAAVLEERVEEEDAELEERLLVEELLALRPVAGCWPLLRAELDELFTVRVGVEAVRVVVGTGLGRVEVLLLMMVMLYTGLSWPGV